MTEHFDKANPDDGWKWPQGQPQDLDSSHLQWCWH